MPPIKGDGTLMYKDFWVDHVHYEVYTTFTSECKFYFSPWGQIALTPGERIFIDLLALATAIGAIAKPLDRSDSKVVYHVWLETGNTVFVPLSIAEQWVDTPALAPALTAYNFDDIRFGVYSCLLEAVRKRAARDLLSDAEAAQIARFEYLRDAE